MPTTKLYIHSFDSIHGLGIAIESDDVIVKQKFIDYCFKYIINNTNVRKILCPFYQCGYDNIQNNYHYFEMLGLAKTDNKNIDLFFDVCFTIADELQLPLDIE